LAEVIRFKIDDDCMGWVLNKADGTRIYVKIHTGGRGGSRFHGWLGGDFGFTIEPIATKCGPSIAIAAPSSVASPQNDHSHRSSRDQNPRMALEESPGLKRKEWNAMKSFQFPRRRSESMANYLTIPLGVS